ncbi:MAG TPA: sigma-70 family RNA polymerase sigma factor [Methylomirabilota bacterium]|nr:sigma-70 family RNA polymerase sigma factor [Methylomirabilota bacterium]
MTVSDIDLLRRWTRDQSEEAFATLVNRHMDMVYSVALRQVRDPHLAQEVAQSVFVILARKASSLGSDTILAGWLCRTARFTSSKALTMRQRRLHREHLSFLESSSSGSDDETDNAWQMIEGDLDNALSQLGRQDHDALVLRFCQGRSFREVSSALGTSEAGAKMRVQRALEKLRGYFGRKGISLSAVVIGGAISAHSVQAAPVGLAAATAAAALNASTLSSSTLLVIKETLQYMAWTKVKTAGIIGVAALLTVGTVTVISQKTTAPSTKTTQSVAAAYGTPEATLKSLVAALQAADTEKFAEGCTPEKAEQFRMRNLGKPEEELKAEAQRQAAMFAKAKLVARETNGTDEVHLRMEMPAGADGLQGKAGQLVLVMKKVGQTWKYHGDRR